MANKKTLGLLADTILACLGILAAAIPTLLGFASLYFPWASSWLSELPLEAISVSVLGLLLTYVIVERRAIFLDAFNSVGNANRATAQGLEQLEQQISELSRQQSRNTTRIIASTSGIETISFDNAIELKKYVNEMTKSAQRQVLDSTWAHPTSRGVPRTPQEDIEFQKIERQHSDIVAKVSKNCTYRELFILSRLSRVEKLKRRQRDKSPGYYCKVVPESHIPRLQFIVIDDELAVFVSANHSSLFAVRHEALVKILVDYFDDAWNSDAALTLVDNHGKGAVWDEQLANRTILEAEKVLSR